MRGEERRTCRARRLTAEARRGKRSEVQRDQRQQRGERVDLGGASCDGHCE